MRRKRVLKSSLPLSYFAVTADKKNWLPDFHVFSSSPLSVIFASDFIETLNQKWLA
jgi:hypothetical protein